MDVKRTFLNENLQEEVCMTQPNGFTSNDNANKVCKLKQATKSWNIYFNEAIKGFDFIKIKDETCVYKKASGSVIIFLVLYVDDIMLIGNDILSRPKLRSCDWRTSLVGKTH